MCMSNPTPENHLEVVNVLSAYLSNELRIRNYGQFFENNERELRDIDPIAVGMLIATYEGVCENPPLGSLKEASVAAWAYLQVGSISMESRGDFVVNVKSMLTDVASQRSGVLLAQNSVEEIADGYILLAETLNEGIEPVLAKGYVGVASHLGAVQERAEFDLEHTYEGTVVLETAAVEWLLDYTQTVIDHATILLTYEGLPVGLKDELENALESLRVGYDSFTQDAG